MGSVNAKDGQVKMAASTLLLDDDNTQTDDVVNICLCSMTSHGLPDQRPDWQNTRSVVECNRYMLENQIECDIDFVLQTGTGRHIQVPAHKYVLMSRNPVFFAMFTGPLAERGKQVRISDVTPLAFRQMLR